VLSRNAGRFSTWMLDRAAEKCLIAGFVRHFLTNRRAAAKPPDERSAAWGDRGDPAAIGAIAAIAAIGGNCKTVECEGLFR